MLQFFIGEIHIWDKTEMHFAESSSHYNVCFVLRLLYNIFVILFFSLCEI